MALLAHTPAKISSDKIIMTLAAKNPKIIEYIRDLMNYRGNPVKLIENECASFEAGDSKTDSEIERLYYWILFERLGIKLDEKRQLSPVIGTQRRHLVWFVCYEVLSMTRTDVSSILPWFRFLISTPRKITMKTLSNVLATWQAMKLIGNQEFMQREWMASRTDEQRLAAYEAVAICD